MGVPGVDDPEKQRRLAELEAKIDAAKAAQQPRDHMEEHYSQAQLAWRMVIELVAGLGIGFGIGYGLDSLLGTLPILMVLFTFLGLAAGVKTMIRSAREIQDREIAAGQAEDEKED
jgi:ATP synthase protein I